MKFLKFTAHLSPWLSGVLLCHHTSAFAAHDPAAAAREFIVAHEATIRPLERQSSLAWWNASISGKDEDFKAKEEAQNKLDAALADHGWFTELKSVQKSRLKDPLLRRQIDVLYLQYLEKQVDPELLKRMTAKANAIEQAFNVYRAKVDGRELSDSEVRKILKESTNSTQLRQVWEASKGVGAVLEKDLLDLVRLRNQAARQLGFKDFHVMQLYLNEQSQAKVLKLFDDLDKLTREPFRKAKAEIGTQCLLEQKHSAHGALRPAHRSAYFNH